MSLPVIVITGPTATGKSETAVKVAEFLGSEIISADSIQVYRHFNIGTAKPSEALRNRVPHHLIDCLEPDEDFTAFEFRKRAETLIRRLHSRNRIPVIVGGTGLYLRVLTEGLDCAIPANQEIRTKIRQEIQEQGPEALHAELQSVDPEAASRIRPTDPLRIERALEVYRFTGTPLSKFHMNDQQGESPFDTQVFVLEMERARLYQAINKRVDSMLDQGWLEEVRGLLQKGYSTKLKPFLGIGYSTLVKHLQGECSYETAVEEIKRDTRHYAKRQVTWFNKYAPSQPLPVTATDTPDTLAETIRQRLPQAIAAGAMALWMWVTPVASQAAPILDIPSVGQKIHRGDIQEACEQLPKILQSVPQETTESHLGGYLEGHCLAHEKKWPEARKWLQTALINLPELEDFIRFDLAKTAFLSGDLKPAREEVTTLLTNYGDSLIAAEGEMLRSEILKAQGDVDQALFFLQEAISRWSKDEGIEAYQDYLPELHFREARLHEIAGAPSRAYLAYRKVYVQYPGHEKAGQAEKAVARLVSQKSMPNPPLTTLEVESRVQGLMKSAKYQEALDTLVSFETENPGKPRSPDFYFYFASAYRGIRERMKTVETLKEFLKAYPLHVKVQDARFKIGRTLWNLGRNDEAIRYFDTIGQTTSKKSWKIRSHFYQGRVYENTGRPEEARKHYRVLMELAPKSSYTMKAAWRLGWMAFRQEKWLEAAEQFAANSKQWPDNVRASKNLFWEAKARERIADHETAQKTYATLVDRFPYTFYGVRAEDKLNDRKAEKNSPPRVIRTGFETPEEQVDVLERPLTDTETFHHNRALHLAEIGWYDYSRQEAKKVAASIRKNLSGTLWLSRLFIKTRSYPDALRLLFLYRDFKTPSKEKELPLGFWKHFFPLAYFEMVETAAREFEVDPLFVDGLIRQESMFDADIVSPAGARGLMQIMPETGRRLFSPGPRYSSYDPDVLFDPALNVRLGVKYLSNLTRKFGPNGIHLLISYNAGPHVLKKWLKRFADIKDEDVFVESIPYPETRGYVKRVLRNYGIYQRLYLKGGEKISDNKSF